MLVPPLGSNEELRLPLRQIIGPRMRCFEVSQEVKDLVHEVELGHREAPLLKLDSQTMRVVCTDPTNLQAWMIYQLGRFSTARVAYVDLAPEVRRASQLAHTRFAVEQETMLLNLVGAEQLPGEEDDAWHDDEDVEEHPEEDEPDER